MKCREEARARRRALERRLLGYALVLVALLFVVACSGQPAGGIIPRDSSVVGVAQKWARGLQDQDEQLFASTINPAKLAPPGLRTGTLMAYDDVLVSTFAKCGTDVPDADALVTDGTRRRERYMVTGRYPSKCLQSRDVPATDTFVVHELTVDGTPK